MYFSDSITLKAPFTTQDSYGQPIPAYTDTIVFANKKSVTRSEFYPAHMAGIKIDTIFAVHPEDFSDQHTAATCAVKAASAVTDILTVTATATLGIVANALEILLTTAANDTLAVTKTDGTKTINIALAKTTATKNTAALIQAAIRALSTVGGIDVTGFACTASGNWDTAAKATGEAAAVDFSGGKTPPTMITYGSTNYEIIRAYQQGEGVVELMCVVREVI